MPIIATTDTSALNQIRSLVSIAYDALDIDDTTIAQDVFLGDANLRIQAAVPTWSEIAGDNLTRLRITTMKQCAVNILAAFDRTKREETEELSQEVIQLTPAEAIKRYEGEIADSIEILNPSSTSDNEATVLLTRSRLSD